jgi:excisionase family DNA binding protein
MKGYKTIEEAAQELKLTRQCLHQHIQKEKLKVEKAGKLYLIEDSEIERFKKSREDIQDKRYKIF